MSSQLKENRNRCSQVISAGLRVLFSTLAVYWLTDTEHRGFAALVFCLIFAFLYSRPFLGARQKEARVIGAVLAVLTITAKNWPDRLAEVFRMRSALVFCFACFCLYRLFSDLLVCLYSFWRTREGKENILRSRSSAKRVFLISFPIIWTIFFLFFLNQYPGSFDCDTPGQMNEIFTGHFRNENPLLNTLSIGACVKLGLFLTGNINAGVALYTFLQFTAAAALYAYTGSVIWRKGYPLWAVILSQLFFGLMPHNIAFATGMWKDTFFALLFLWTMVRLWVLLDKQSTKWEWAGVFVLALATALARNSGWSSLLPFGAALCFFGRHQRNVVKLGTAVLGGVAAALAVIGILYPMCGVKSVRNPAMIMSVPLQQVGRVLAVGGDVSQEDLALISQVIDPEYAKEKYQENLSDPIKFVIDGKIIQQNSREYVKLWLRLGARNPLIYYDAYVALMKGYWDLEYRSWLWDGSVFENDYGIERTPIFMPERDLDQVLKGIAYNYGSSVKSYVLFRAPLVVWSTLICLGYALVQKRTISVLFYIPILCVFAGLMLTSPGPLFRYTYCTTVCLPLIWCLAFWKPVKQP